MRNFLGIINGRYWHALFYYGEAEKVYFDPLAKRLRLELEQKIRAESRKKGEEGKRGRGEEVNEALPGIGDKKDSEKDYQTPCK